MSILIAIVEHISKRKMKNRDKIVKEIQKFLIELHKEESEVLNSLVIASDYETFYYTMTKLLKGAKIGLKTTKKKEEKRFFRSTLNFVGYLKFVIDFHKGYLGFLWL